MKHEISLMEQVEILRAACCIAAADGEISEAERGLIERMAIKAGVGRASREAMIEQGLTSPKFIESQFRFLLSNPDRAMKVLMIMASADGAIGEAEESLVRNFAARLSIDEGRLEQLLRAGQDAADQHVDGNE